ncbi:hypothetical protein Ciccas_010809 [Cichlidogyrus casuarinus]|uniref:Uncharacterized protein n=1 Tax=Cichlidogyrus casuarinus TaxID=1844966 RepID=A0ABD2PT15_9PLAT
MFNALQLVQGIKFDSDGLVNVPHVIMYPEGLPEVVLVHAEVVSLVQSLQLEMLAKLKGQVVKRMEFAVKERSRMTDMVPMDLWKKQGIHESATIQEPPLSENLISELLRNVQEKEDSNELTISKEALLNYLQFTGNQCARNNRDLHQRYSIFYESLLSSSQKSMNKLELENSQLKTELEGEKRAANIKMMFEMHEKLQMLLSEVVGFRAFLHHLITDRRHQAKEIREEVSRQFSQTAVNIFAFCYQQNSLFDTFRTRLYQQATDQIATIRNRTFMELLAIREKLNIKQSPCERELSDELVQTRNEFAEQELKLKTMKALEWWRRATVKNSLTKQVNELTFQLANKKIKLITMNRVGKERFDQMDALVKKLQEQLSSSERELHILYQISKKDFMLKNSYKQELDKKLQVDAEMNKVRQMQEDKFQMDKLELEQKLKLAQNSTVLATTKFEEASANFNKNTRLLQQQLNEEKRYKKIAIDRSINLQKTVEAYERKLGMSSSLSLSHLLPLLADISTAQPVSPKKEVRTTRLLVSFYDMSVEGEVRADEAGFK